MFGLSPSTIIYGVIALAVVSYVGHCEYVKKDRAQFIAKLEAQAEAQNVKIAAQVKHDRENKEKADAENKKTTDALRATIQRLRDSSGSRFVPPASASAKRPDLACYGRSDLDAEIRAITGTSADVLGELGKAAVNMNTALKWAKEIR
jgi:hypothetical protein